MAFWEVIDLDHQGQPDLTRRDFGRTALIEQAGKMLRRKPRDPGIDGGPGDTQEPTDADFFPALGVEFDHLQARLVAVRLAVVVPQGQGLLCNDGTLLPEPLGGLVVNAFAKFIEDDADEFPRMEPRIERLEAGNLLGDRRGDSRSFLFGDDLDSVQEQAEHALMLEAPRFEQVVNYTETELRKQVGLLTVVTE